MRPRRSTYVEESARSARDTSGNRRSARCRASIAAIQFENLSVFPGMCRNRRWLSWFVVELNHMRYPLCLSPCQGLSGPRVDGGISMRTFFKVFAGPLVLLTALSTSSFAQEPQHTVSPSDLAATVAGHVTQQDADRAAIREALGQPTVKDLSL